MLFFYIRNILLLDMMLYILYNEIFFYLSIRKLLLKIDHKIVAKH